MTTLEDLPADLEIKILEFLGDADLARYSCASRRTRELCAPVLKERAQKIYLDVLEKVDSTLTAIQVQMEMLQSWVSSQIRVTNSGIFEYGELRGCMNSIACASVIPVETIGYDAITMNVVKMWEKVVGNLLAYHKNILTSILETTGQDYGVN